MEWRRRRLELLLRIKRLPPEERYREWTRHYVKKNKRWVERGPKPRRALVYGFLEANLLGTKVKPEAAGK